MPEDTLTAATPAAADPAPSDSAPPAADAPAATGDVAINQPAADQPPAVQGETQPSAQDAPPADAPPPGPTAEQLRGDRIDFLNRIVEMSTLGRERAIAERGVEGIVEHRGKLRQILANRIESPENVQLVINMLLELPSFPIPKEIDADWITLARRVFDIWRLFFGVAKPADQVMNDMLHSLGNSIETGKTLGKLARSAESTRFAGHLTEHAFESILDGHQSKELQKAGVAPNDIIALVDAISVARAMMAAAAETKIAGPQEPKEQ